MTDNEKVEQMTILIGNDADLHVMFSCLSMAKAKILNRRYPFVKNHSTITMESSLDQLHIELAIVLYNQRGAEGESSHDENGVSRTYRSVASILAEITPMAGLPNATTSNQ